jgi:hypothetical protein
MTVEAASSQVLVVETVGSAVQLITIELIRRSHWAYIAC